MTERDGDDAGRGESVSGWVPPAPFAPEPAAPPVPPVPPVPPTNFGIRWNAPLQSSGSASDDDLGDHLAIDASVNQDDTAAPGFAAAPSPPPRPVDSGKHRRFDSDLTRLDAAAVDTPMLPRSDEPIPALPGAVAPQFIDEAPAAAGKKRFGRRRYRPARRKAPWWELPLLVAVAILIAVVVKTFVVQPFYIPSQSMEKTLHGCPGCKGDRILVNKPIYDLRDPHPGDIVVFHAPPGWDDEPPSVPPHNPVLRVVRGFGQLIGFVPPDGLVLVKRVIATGGQTVKGDASGHVEISDNGTNGPWRTLAEPFVYTDGVDSHATFGPVTIPKGRLWVMGDHRNDSADSRFHCGAGGSQGDDGAGCDATASTVAVHNVIGKAVLIAWPPSRWRTLGTPPTFKHAAQVVPAGASVLVVFPLYLARRRRRRGERPPGRRPARRLRR